MARAASGRQLALALVARRLTPRVPRGPIVAHTASPPTDSQEGTHRMTISPATTYSTRNVFAEYIPQVYPFTFAGRLHIERLMGGTPSDPNVAEGWLKSKMGITKEEALQEAVAEVMAARGCTEEEALADVNRRKHLNGFKKNEDGDLYIEGRHLKAALKEAASVARAAENLASRFGTTNKGTLSFVAEHIIVVEDRLVLGKFNPATGKVENVTECDEIVQSFPRNPMTRQTGIQYTEAVDDAVIEFTVQTDWPFTAKEWAAIWVTGGNQGIGASRSQGYGRYKVTRWDMIGTGIRINADKTKKEAAKKKKADGDDAADTADEN